MESGDGLLVRLRISGGIVDIALAQQIARWSRHWGNGQIDLSNRGNLQVRGLAVRHLPALHEALAEYGLLDGSEAGEAVRNVISSPLAGLDPGAVLDVRPMAQSLEHRLVHDAALHALPGKFGFVLDDGGMLGLDEVPADIRFIAVQTNDGPAFDIHLDGAAHDCLGPCHPAAVGDVAAALSDVFLRHRAERGTLVRRMRDMVAAHGAEAIAGDATLAHAHSPRAARAARPASFLGAHRLGSAGFLGVGLPFGRIMAEDFAELASAAAANGAPALHLTPWRAILAPVPSMLAAQTLSAGLTEDRFVLDPADTRRRIAACSGAPSCARGTTPARGDAVALAAETARAVSDQVAPPSTRHGRASPGHPPPAAGAKMAGTTLPRVLGRPAITNWCNVIGNSSNTTEGGVVLHVSGCEKGCAHPGAARVTLVGRDGRYDLVDDGVASDAPTLRNLTLAQAAEQVRNRVADQSAGDAA